MNSVLEGKEGNRFETDYVVHQMLRLLSGSVGRLKWDWVAPQAVLPEGSQAGKPDSGIDLLLHSDEGTIAVQIKHRSNPRWPLSALRGVLQDARRALEDGGPDRIDRFCFFSDARSIDLEKSIEAASGMISLSGPYRTSAVERNST